MTLRNTGVRRRTFLTGATAAAVVALDPVGLGWLTAADAEPDGIQVPGLDGELLVDPGSRAAAAEDYGQIVHHYPVAVLRPGSVRDIVTMIRFANRYDLRVAMRGQGHSVYGQAQVRAGIVIDSRTLATIHRVSPAGAVVDAGARWLDVIQATLPHGLTPPVSTDYIGLSVGGTLSVGGLGGASSHHGLQVDNVSELEVVTGSGQLRRCSRIENPDLFHAVLGGLGQFAIIVRATVSLVPAQTTARIYRLSYPTVAALTTAQRTALADGRFDYLEGQAIPTDTGGWSYLLEGAAYFTDPNTPDDSALLAGLDPTATEITQLPYFDWLDRITDLVDQLKQLRFPNPWINLFLPDAVTDEFVSATLATTTPADTGGGPVFLYPVPRARLGQPFVSVPDSRIVFFFGILRVVVPPNDAEVSRLLEVNRRVYERARGLGGTLYPISALEMSPSDWQVHFGRWYPAFAAAKARFDPGHVLTPGQGIFAR